MWGNAEITAARRAARCILMAGTVVAAYIVLSLFDQAARADDGVIDQIRKGGAVGAVKSVSNEAGKSDPARMGKADQGDSRDGWEVPSESRKVAPAKVAVRKVAPAKVAVRKVAPTKVAVRKNGPAKVAVRKDAPAKVAVRKGGPAKVAVRKDMPAKVGARTDRPAKVAVRKVSPAKVGKRKIAPAGVAVPEDEPARDADQAPSAGVAARTTTSAEATTRMVPPAEATPRKVASAKAVARTMTSTRAVAQEVTPAKGAAWTVTSGKATARKVATAGVATPEAKSAVEERKVTEATARRAPAPKGAWSLTDQVGEVAGPEAESLVTAATGGGGRRASTAGAGARKATAVEAVAPAPKVATPGLTVPAGLDVHSAAPLSRRLSHQHRSLTSVTFEPARTILRRHGNLLI